MSCPRPRPRPVGARRGGAAARRRGAGAGGRAGAGAGRDALGEVEADLRGVVVVLDCVLEQRRQRREQRAVDARALG